MNEPDTTPGDDISDDHLRQLLASSRVQEPMPPEVVGRLDDVLASLVSERAKTAPDRVSGRQAEPPIDLAAERGRRRRTWIGVAAAAVVVVAAGVTLPQMFGPSDPTSDRSNTAASETLSEVAALPELTSDSTTDDVTAFVRALDVPSPTAELQTKDQADGAHSDFQAPSEQPDLDAAYSSHGRVTAAHSQCGWKGRGDLYLVSYDGAPADLVLRTVGDTVVARVITCSDGAEPTVAKTVIVSPAT